MYYPNFKLTSNTYGDYDYSHYGYGAAKYFGPWVRNSHCHRYGFNDMWWAQVLTDLYREGLLSPWTFGYYARAKYDKLLPPTQDFTERCNESVLRANSVFHMELEDAKPFPPNPVRDTNPLFPSPSPATYENLDIDPLAPQRTTYSTPKNTSSFWKNIKRKIQSKNSNLSKEDLIKTQWIPEFDPNNMYNVRFIKMNNPDIK